MSAPSPRFPTSPILPKFAQAARRPKRRLPPSPVAFPTPPKAGDRTSNYFFILLSPSISSSDSYSTSPCTSSRRARLLSCCSQRSLHEPNRVHPATANRPRPYLFRRRHPQRRRRPRAGYIRTRSPAPRKSHDPGGPSLPNPRGHPPRRQSFPQRPVQSRQIHRRSSHRTHSVRTGGMSSFRQTRPGRRTNAGKSHKHAQYRRATASPPPSPTPCFHPLNSSFPTPSSMPPTCWERGACIWLSIGTTCRT